MVPKFQPDLFNVLLDKGHLKQQVYQNTLKAFLLLKQAIRDLDSEYHRLYDKDPRAIPFVHQERGDFETPIPPVTP